MTGEKLSIDWKSVQRRLGVHADGVAGPITFTAIFRYMGAPSPNAAALGAVAGPALARAGILLSKRRLAHWLGQLAHESGGFRWLREIWGPTAAQRRYERDMSKPWPSTPAQSRLTSHRPNSLAYTLGNSQPGDGKKYAGRGIIQLTGRANYARFGAMLGLPFVENPALAAVPSHAVAVACAYWLDRGLNALADARDVAGVTKRINGGSNGLGDRTIRTARAAELLA